MKWLLGLLMPYRSFLIGLAGVLFVAMTSGMVMGWMQLKAKDARIETQAERITDLTQINKDWAKHAATQDKLRSLEQENALALQEQLATIEAHYSETSEQLERLKESSDETRAYLAGKLPSDLRKLLSGK